jgi:acetyl-CoA carboxylase biotin carboxylase subunit
MFDKVLIANRGEIALRIIRACKELGVRTIAVYSEADTESMHVHAADDAICIGRGPAQESYLRIDRIIAAAEIADVDAIHPGYGFLAENAHFAEVCEHCKIKFIGPTPSAIRAMGDKNQARAVARKSGVPVTPGSDGIVETEKEAIAIANKIGYPVMIKAVAGGGGRGMRAAHNDGSLVQGYHSARMEAEKAFNNAAVYIEKLIENPHHIEIQVLADQQGNVVALGERDCSIQRRNQKLIEEAPSPLISDATRKTMSEAAIQLCKTVGYENAGTLEFLADDHGHFYFMEMNTRVQVEHPVTEIVWNVDIVREQIAIAAGEPLSELVRQARPSQHAIEVRLNAEDPQNNFRPCPGKLAHFVPPGGPGIRVDTHAYSGYSIPPFYDSMIAKLIAFGPTRAMAIERMSRALGECLVEGVHTTLPLAYQVMNDPDFRRGHYNTAFLEHLMSQQQPAVRPASTR